MAEKDAQKEAEEAKAEAEQAEKDAFNPDITESEWAEMQTRQSQEDAKWLFASVRLHGGPNVVPDPEPEEESALDETYQDAAVEAPAAEEPKPKTTKK